MDVSHELGSIRHIVDSSLSSKVAMFNKVANQHKTSQLLNPFASVDGRSSPKPSFSKDEYGKPLAGSLTEQRGHKANLHIFKEILELCQIIDSEGFIDEDHPDQKIIFFGDLFNIYNHISDKCVGLLLRARKHKLIEFEGEILFQRRDDEVPIFMLKPLKEIRTMLEEKQDEIKRAVSPAPQPTTLIGSNKNSPTHSPTPDKKNVTLCTKNSAASLDFKPIQKTSELSVEITNEAAPVPLVERNDNKNDKITAHENRHPQANWNKVNENSSSASIEIVIADTLFKNENKLEDKNSVNSVNELLVTSCKLSNTEENLYSDIDSYLGNVTIPSETCSKSSIFEENSSSTMKSESGTDSDTTTNMILEPKVKSGKPTTETFDLNSKSSSIINVSCFNLNNNGANTTIKSDDSNQSIENLLLQSAVPSEDTISDKLNIKQSNINLIDSSYNLQNGFGSDCSIGDLDAKEVLVSDIVVHYEPTNQTESLIENGSENKDTVVTDRLENNSVTDLKLNLVVEANTALESKSVQSESSVADSSSSKVLIAQNTIENNTSSELKSNIILKSNTSESKSVQSESVLTNSSTLKESVITENSVENISQTCLDSKSNFIEKAAVISSDVEIKSTVSNSQLNQPEFTNAESASTTKSEILDGTKTEISNIDLEIKPTELNLTKDNKTKYIESQLEAPLELKSEISPNVTSGLSEKFYSLEKEEQHSIPVKVSP